MPRDPSNSYDEVPYPSYPHRLTHPDWLGTVGAIFGMNPAPAEGCRVLELGCANGDNLLPMAATLPESTFVGIDSSAREIAAGQAMIQRAGLRNLELRHASILDVDDRYGLFDYVICYGVFSWVPRPVKDAILAICQRNLAPQGIAYVNYNARPGGHLMHMMREMMTFAARGSKDPAEKVARGRALVDLLVDWGPDPQLRPFVMHFAATLKRSSDSYVFHDYFEETNDRLYFLDFVDRAGAADLQFLGDAHLLGMFAHERAPGAAQTALVRMMPSLLLREQAMDFLTGRSFRETLLCRKEIPLKRRIEPDTLSSLCFGSMLAPTQEPVDVRTEGPATFEATGRPRVTTSMPILKAALTQLHLARPSVVPFASISAAARQLAGIADTSVRPETDLAVSLWDLFTRGAVEIRRRPYSLRIDVGDRPRATALARLQAVDGPQVTNLRHERVEIDPASRRVLAALDGASDHARITARVGETEGGDLPEEAIDAALRGLASSGLLLP